jgi:hypothetical protein
MWRIERLQVGQFVSEVLGVAFCLHYAMRNKLNLLNEHFILPLDFGKWLPILIRR